MNTLHGRSQRRLLAILLLTALVVRIYWGWTRSDAAIDSLPDQREYLELGQSLLRDGTLRFTDPRLGVEVRAYRTPGYPLFVAACGGIPRVVRVVQAFLDTSTVLAIFLLARSLEGSPARGIAPLLAAAAVAFNPFLIYFSGLLLSETLFTALLAWGMALLAMGRIFPAQQRWRGIVPWLAGTLILALSVVVRPSAMFLPVALAVISTCLNLRHSTAYERKWAIVAAAVQVSILIVVLFPWAYRNHRVLGRWLCTTTNSGITLYDGFNPQASGGSDQSFVGGFPRLRTMTEVERSQYLETLASNFIYSHPGKAAALAIRKFFRTWSPVPLSREFGSTLYRVAALAYSVPFDTLVILGVIRGRLARPAKAFLLIPAVYFTVVHMLSVGSLRYRVPVEAPMAVIAASLWNAARTQGTRLESSPAC